jgi:5-methylcytosine-specific restriction endonuclease McrA
MTESRQINIRSRQHTAPDREAAPAATGAASTSLELNEPKEATVNVSQPGDICQVPLPPTITMRAVCRDCGCPDGVVITKGGQDTVRCSQCDRYAGYNAPRIETGRPRRSLRSRPQISPSQRSRILQRDNSTCLRCGRLDVPLNVSHWISVHDGTAEGLSDPELFDDENLLVLCAECNAGQGRETLPLRFMATVLRVRIARRRNAS